MNTQNRQAQTRNLTVTALLTALGIIIPMIMPVKVVIGPASYTLGSHVPVNMAIFRSPMTAFIVAIGTTIGFLMAGFPIVIVMRALSHLIYATAGAYYLQKHPTVLNKLASRTLYNFVLNLIHGIAEVIVVYVLTAMGLATMAPNYLYVLIVLVGFGTLVHGMIDFEIAYQLIHIINQRTRIKFTEYAV